MKKFRVIYFNLSEHIPVARWCLALVVISFTAVVSVYKYIDLADMAVFSSFETLFMILTDITNIVFIYLPLYLFIVCGIMFDSGFGGVEILRCGSRVNWLAGKFITYIVNAVLFFAVLFIINLVVCSQAFSFSNLWSKGFVGFRVMMGQNASDFESLPLPTIIAASAAVLLLYIFCGMVNMFVSLVTDRESTSLFASLFVGIALGLTNMTISSNNMSSYIIRCTVLSAVSAAVYVFCIAAVNKKDFCEKRLY